MVSEQPVEGLRGAVAGRDRRRALEALADVLAAAVVVAEVQNVAALSKQLADVMRELDELPADKESSPVDDLAAKRSARRAAAKDRRRA